MDPAGSSSWQRQQDADRGNDQQNTVALRSSERVRYAASAPPPALQREQAARTLLNEQDNEHQIAILRARAGDRSGTVGDAERKRAHQRAHKLPTPPNTTTMNESMM